MDKAVDQSITYLCLLIGQAGDRGVVRRCDISAFLLQAGVENAGDLAKQIIQNSSRGESKLSQEMTRLLHSNSSAYLELTWRMFLLMAVLKWAASMVDDWGVQRVDSEV